MIDTFLWPIGHIPNVFGCQQDVTRSQVREAWGLAGGGKDLIGSNDRGNQ